MGAVNFESEKGDVDNIIFPRLIIDVFYNIALLNKKCVKYHIKNDIISQIFNTS